MKRYFICRKCEVRFDLEVLDVREAKERRIPVQPVRCIKCGGAVEQD